MLISKRSLLKLSALSFSLATFTPRIAIASVQAPDKITEYAKKIKDDQKITLKLLYPEGCKNNLLPLTQKFSQKTGVNFEFIETSVDDINTKILIDSAAQRSEYDLALPATFGMPDLAEAKAIKNLTTLAKIYEPKINYQKSLYSLGDQYKGRFYGYQTDGDVYLMFYNKMFFDNPNIQKEYEDKFAKQLSLPKTWQELDQQMAFFHNPEKQKYGGCLFRTPRYMVWEWWIRFHAKGEKPLNDDASANIYNDAGIKALEDLIQATKYQHPSCKTNNLFQNWSVFAQGECAVNIGWGGTQKHLNSDKSNLRGKLYHTPTPGTSYFNWGWNYVVSSYSEHPEIAYLFSLFATLPENSIESVKEDGFFDPYRMEHYENPAIIERYSKPFLKAHKTAMMSAIPDFYIQSQSDYISELQENINLAHEGAITAEEAMKFTARKWNELTDKNGKESQAKQWMFLKKQYPNI